MPNTFVLKPQEGGIRVDQWFPTTAPGTTSTEAKVIPEHSSSAPRKIRSEVKFRSFFKVRHLLFNFIGRCCSTLKGWADPE